MTSWLGTLLDPPTVSEKDGCSFPLNSVIDFMKGITPVVILGMMFWHKEAPYRALDNTCAWIYLGIHGCYGVLWVAKSRFGFGDAKWKQRKSIWFLPNVVLSLALYWLPIYYICQQTSHDTPNWLMGLAVFLFGSGVFYHYCSDMQKTMFLEYRALSKKHNVGQQQGNVLQDKLWANCRNPNYFGELLIYTSFAILARHWVPMVWLGCMISVYWMYNMMLKEKSLSRFKDEFERYKAQSAFFIPHVW